MAAIPLVTLSTLSVSKAEGNSPNVTPFSFTVSRSGSYAQPSSIDWAIVGTGAHPVSANDFQGNAMPSGTVVLSKSVSSAVVTVYIQGDTTYEPDETFSIKISNPVNCTLGNTVSTGTVLNDDPAPPTPAPPPPPPTGSGKATDTLTFIAIA